VFKATIFDIDGTLIDSVDLHAQSWVEAFSKFGIDAEFEHVRRHIGEGADRLIAAFAPPDLSDTTRKKIEDFRSDLFKREYLCKVKPFPKVPELFERIHADSVQLVLASSCTRDEIDHYKAIAGITGVTDCDVTADDAGSSKPSPDIFLEALSRLAPIRGSDSCVIGDTKYDGEAARQAGIPFVGLLCGGSSREELERSGAIAIYRDPADLLENWQLWRELGSDRSLRSTNS
jgi:phosphoglycolate phosphatase-like HAD superfamily hydrolase